MIFPERVFGRSAVTMIFSGRASAPHSRTMQKASREAKLDTSWMNPDEAYEADLAAFVRGMVADPDVQRLDQLIDKIIEKLQAQGYLTPSPNLDAERERREKEIAGQKKEIALLTELTHHLCLPHKRREAELESREREAAAIADDGRRRIHDVMRREQNVRTREREAEKQARQDARGVFILRRARHPARAPLLRARGRLELDVQSAGRIDGYGRWRNEAGRRRVHGGLVPHLP